MNRRGAPRAPWHPRVVALLVLVSAPVVAAPEVAPAPRPPIVTRSEVLPIAWRCEDETRIVTRYRADTRALELDESVDDESVRTRRLSPVASRRAARWAGEGIEVSVSADVLTLARPGREALRCDRVPPPAVPPPADMEVLSPAPDPLPP